MKSEQFTNKAGKVRHKFELTSEEYAEHAEEYGGFCIACGEAAFGVEPDARGYDCESCGESKVYGAEELLLRGFIVIAESKG